MSEHTPTPWEVSDHPLQTARGWIKSTCKGFPERMVAQSLGQPTVDEREANAAFIVKAVNSHDMLVKALQKAEELYLLGIMNAPDGLTAEVVTLRRDALAVVGGPRK